MLSSYDFKISTSTVHVDVDIIYNPKVCLQLVCYVDY